MGKKYLRRIMLFVCIILCLSVCAVYADNDGEKLIYDYDKSAGLVLCNERVTGTSTEEVTVSAQAYEGFDFVGWTKGAYLEDYGELVSENVEYTFTNDGYSKYYANFVKQSEVLVCYHANGGAINNENAQENCLIQKVDLKKHKYPATLAHDGTFSRPGYVLTEYTSEADGSGEVTNIGQRAFFDKKVIHLYAQWSKETDGDSFEFHERENGLWITDYTGHDKVLTIPTFYNGKNVVGICSNAIQSTSIERVIIPESITVIEDAAFSKCSSLHTVYLYDTVTEMTDDSFEECPIQTVCLNSVYNMKYYAEGVGKLELLHSTMSANTNRLVVISGSSGIFGLDGQLLQDSLNNDYQVVNFGLQIAIPISFSMQITENYLHSGDAILLAPECEFKQFNNALTTNTFIKFDGVFTSMRSIDISDYTSFFSALSMYSLAKQYDTAKLYENSAQFYSDTGDSGNRNEHKSFPATYKFKDPTKRSEMTSEVYQRNNIVIDSLKNNGIKVYLSFAPFATEACAETVTTEMLDDYSKTLAENLNAVCISSQSAHNYAIEYFFEMFHMTAEGKRVRTEQLIKELNAQFSLENN